MNEQNLNPNEPVQSSKHIWITVIAVIITAIIVGGIVYAWQKSSLRATEQSLEQQITDLQNQIQQLQQKDTGVSNPTDQSPEEPSVDQQDTTQADSNLTKVTDKASLYSINIPTDWIITSNEGAMGVQLSRILAQSPDWSHYSDETYEGPFSPQYYQFGGSLQLHITKGESEPAHYGEGGGPETGVITKKTVTVDGIEGVYHVFKEPSTFEGQLIDVHMNYKGNNYLLRLAYNPTNFNGEEFFDDLLASFRFLK